MWKDVFSEFRPGLTSSEDDIARTEALSGEAAAGSPPESAATGGIEYEVWVLGADLENIHFGGADLLAFVKGLQGRDIPHILGEGASPLPSTFEGDDAASLAAHAGTA